MHLALPAKAVQIARRWCYLPPTLQEFVGGVIESFMRFETKNPLFAKAAFPLYENNRDWSEATPALMHWMFDALPMAVALTDLDGRILRANLATATMFREGAKPSDIEGKTMSEISNGRAEHYLDTIREVARTKTPVGTSFEARMPNKGKYKKMFFGSVPYIEKSGAVSKVVHFCLDMEKTAAENIQLSIPPVIS